MRRRKSSAPFSGINIVPLVDVTLVLLIIFMATAAFEREAGVGLNLPGAATAQTREDSSRAGVLSLTRDGSIHLDGAAVPPARLEAALRLKRRSVARLTVRADARLDYGRVMRALDAARRAGFADIALAARPEGRD